MSAVLVAQGYLAGVRVVEGIAFSLAPIAAIWAMLPRNAFADPPSDGGKASTDYARQLSQQVDVPSVDTASGSITLKSPNGQINGSVLSTRAVYAAPAASSADGQYSATRLQNAGTAYGDQSAMLAVADATRADLLTPGQASPWANAYKTIRNVAVSHQHPNLSNDATFAKSKAVWEGTDPGNVLGSIAGNCVKSETTVDSNTSKHIVDYKTCNKPGIPPQGSGQQVPASCSVKRTAVKVGPERSIYMRFTATSVTRNLVIDVLFEQIPAISQSITLDETVNLAAFAAGPVGQSIGMSVSMRSTTGQPVVSDVLGRLELRILSPSELESDQVAPGKVVVQNKWDGTLHKGLLGFANGDQCSVDPPDAWITCELSNSPKLNNPIPSNSHETWFTISVTPVAPTAPKLIIDYKATVVDVAVADVQEPAGCLDAAVGSSATCQAFNAPAASVPPVGVLTFLQPQASTDAWQCVDAANYLPMSWKDPATKEELTVIARSAIDDDYWPVLPALYPSEPMGPHVPFCIQAVARDFRCAGPADPGSIFNSPQDTCLPMEQNPKCKWVSSDCLPESVDPATGKCAGYVVTYDCGEDVSVLGGSTETTWQCDGGPIRCSGHECVPAVAVEQSKDFGNAAAQLQIAQQAGTDQNCTEGGECRVFGGTYSNCKAAFFGVQDCCDKPTGANVFTYMAFTAAAGHAAEVSGMANAAGQYAFNTASEILGQQGIDAVNGVAESVQSAWNTVSQPFTSAWQSLTSRTATAAADTAVTADVATVTGEAVEKSFTDNFKDFVMDKFGDQALADAAGEFVGAALEVLSFVGTIYAIYSAITLLVQLIWKCTDDEFQLNVNRDLKSCHMIGTFCSSKVLGVCVERKTGYCCFKSPLSRILQEQIRAQTGQGWGDANAGDCKGFTVEQLAAVDFSKVDLSEYTALLVGANLVPGSYTQADTMYNQTNLTSGRGPNGEKLGNDLATNTAAQINDQRSLDHSNDVIRNTLWANLP